MNCNCNKTNNCCHHIVQCRLTKRRPHSEGNTVAGVFDQVDYVTVVKRVDIDMIDSQDSVSHLQSATSFSRGSCNNKQSVISDVISVGSCVETISTFQVSYKYYNKLLLPGIILPMVEPARLTLEMITKPKPSFSSRDTVTSQG